MRNLFFIVGMLLHLQLFAQKDTFVVRPSFEVVYSQKKKQPLVLTYKVEALPCNATRKGMDFFPEKGIITSLDPDYANNDYDKGHFAPAASFCQSRDLMLSTFSYLNCALQHYKLNRGSWKELEGQERTWAQTEVIKVKIESFYDATPNLLPTGADIPDGFTKTITFTKTGQVRKYYFPNKECPGNFDLYRIAN
jgi:endonuclease G